MTGGALAAKKYLITSTKQISPSVLKALQGKVGAKGAQGLAGPVGAQGPAGANGKDGAAGAKGETGAVGKEGPQGKQGATGATGAKGANGTTGFTETLPSGKTETGTWGIPLASPAGKYAVNISFPIPTTDAPEPIIVGATEQSEPGCPGRGGGALVKGGVAGPGDKPTIPMAEPGKLCVYETESPEVTQTFISFEFNSEEESWEPVPGASQTGTLLTFRCEGLCSAEGTWAVTSE
jgi:hypothetical protein